MTTAGSAPAKAVPEPDRGSEVAKAPGAPVDRVSGARSPEPARTGRAPQPPEPTRERQLLRLVSAPGAKMGDVVWNPTPLIGRTAEISTLLSAVDEANARRAGAVLLSGDAGVGK